MSGRCACRKIVALSSLVLALTGCSTIGRGSIATLIAPGARYVAMGSSFASGPGVTVPADQPENRCRRSADNYAHQLARKRGLELADVSCSGASTAHLLAAWDELAPQIDAVTPATQLVTITIGGNDVGYIGDLISASCKATSPDDPRCPKGSHLPEEAWQQTAAAMHRIAREVRRRAPSVRLVFVDYPAVLPESGTCADIPMPPHEAYKGRETARRLAELTARVAKANGADLVQASAISKAHDACAAEPWMTGWPRGSEGRVPYHPNLAGMTAVADALDRLLFEGM